MSFPSQDRDSLIAFYGNPDANGDGVADPVWYSQNIIHVAPPFPMVWSWGGDVKTLAVHKKCADSLLNALATISATFSDDEITRYQLNRCGGAYNFRLIRGSATRLSLHSYGAAIDLAPELNQMGTEYQPGGLMMPEGCVKAFANAGWLWGGTFTRPDSMHFQATV
jgi:hypothetical protein